MRKIKYLIAAACIVCLTLTLAACGGGKTEDSGKTEDGGKAAQENAGNVSTGAELDFGQNLKWPADSMGKLPEITGKITGVLKDDGSGQCTVAFSEMTKENAQAYIAEMKKMGYTGELSMADEESLVHSGKAADGSTAFFTYNVTAKEGTISYGSGKTSGQSAAEIDRNDAAPWPKNFMESVPELAGRITDVVNDNNKKVTVSLEYVDKAIFEDYIKLLKLNGFTQDADENTSVSAIDFRAYNAQGEWVNAYLRIEEGNNTATITMEKP